MRRAVIGLVSSASEAVLLFRQTCLPMFEPFQQFIQSHGQLSRNESSYPFEEGSRNRVHVVMQPVSITGYKVPSIDSCSIQLKYLCQSLAEKTDVKVPLLIVRCDCASISVLPTNQTCLINRDQSQRPYFFTNSIICPVSCQVIVQCLVCVCELQPKLVAGNFPSNLASYLCLYRKCISSRELFVLHSP